ncbi:RNA-directed DNA polymerase, eukaryota, reverse transcriptase zinc-binding domain protein [Tanacetum coccineum]|uniref:RNA-directed DNA polymerase, eukaryota, reverse transcriptase zinc-binding domain protein n=1 Tax=Tanacetum coccineum TaxID=301880 RepID=A0ABQ5BKV1_9ASTR
MFCRSINEDEKQQILNILPFKVGKLPVRYLGVPLMDKKISIKDCKSLVEKLSKSLMTGKTKVYLMLGEMVVDHVRFKSGNGKKISAWYDRWNENHALAKSIRKREVHLAGFNDQSKLCDVIDANRWKWSAEWFENHSFLKDVPVPTLTDELDCLIWVTNQGKMVNFKTSQVWKDVKRMGVKVYWEKLVWFSQCISRHAFILWLAIKEKLITQDKLIKWYPQKTVSCQLCKKEPYSHGHLFFQCHYAADIWMRVKNRARIRSNASNWKEIIKDMNDYKNHNHIWNILGKLCLAATVYFVWQEKNCRLFNNEIRDKNV